MFIFKFLLLLSNSSLLLFGNINDIIYINDTVKQLIQDIYNIIFTTREQNGDTIIYKVNVPEIWKKYHNIEKQYIDSIEKK